MEQPLVTAVTHSTDEARVTLTGVPDEPGVAGRIFSALAEAERQRRHDHPERAGPPGRAAPRSPSRSTAADLRHRERRARRRSATSARACAPTTEIGKVSVVGAGMRTHPGVAAKVFSVLGRERHQHRDDLHLADQDLLRDPRRPRARGGAGAARGLRARRRRGASRGVQPATEHRAEDRPHERVPGRRRGRHRRRRLDHARGARRARLPGREVVPFASERSAGRKIECDGASSTCRPLSRRRRSRASTSRSSRPAARSAPSGRRASSRPAPWWSTTPASGACTTTCRWSSPRSTPTRSRRHRGIVANPNCSTMQMVVALAPIHDAAGIERLVVSTYQSVSGTGAARDRGAARRRRARCSPASEVPPPQIYPHRIAFNVLPQVETFKDGDDYTTEERKMMAETRKILGVGEESAISATCARVPVVAATRSRSTSRPASDLSPERVPRAARRRARRDRRRRPGRRHLPAGDRRRRAATRCSSGASAATPRTSARSTSGWSATTCARAPPPTRSRSPSCSTSAIYWGKSPHIVGDISPLRGTLLP